MIQSSMVVIGLTGSMAAGKSTISRRMAELGAYIADADKASRQVVLPGMEGLAALVERFGSKILRPDGALDRPALAALAFEGEETISDLNAIMHPIIKIELQAGMAEARKQGVKVAVVDAPLLLEAGWQDICDEVWLVTAPEELRIIRAMARDDISRDAARLRMASQMSDEKKREIADVILENNGSIEDLLAEVDAQYRRLRKDYDEKNH